MKVLSDLVRELQKARDENVSHMNTMNSFSDKIISEEKLTIQNRVRYIHIYVSDYSLIPRKLF